MLKLAVVAMAWRIFAMKDSDFEALLDNMDLSPSPIDNQVRLEVLGRTYVRLMDLDPSISQRDSSTHIYKYYTHAKVIYIYSIYI